MLIEGLQKLTLLDFPGHTACTVFTYGCNFRCPFCHNASLVTKPSQPMITEDELTAFLIKRKGILDGVCITGGEPTLQKDLLPFLGRIRELGYLIKLDTNGSRPDVLRRAVEDKLVDYVAMDIKNAPDKYAETVGVPNLDLTPIRESVAFLLEGHVEYEFRTTVTSAFHRQEDFDGIASLIKGTEKYFLQNFVDSGELIDPDITGYPPETMKFLAEYTKKRIPHTVLRGL